MPNALPVKSAFASTGIYLGVQSTNSNGISESRITACLPCYGRQTVPRERDLLSNYNTDQHLSEATPQEYVVELKIANDVVAIAELPRSSPAAYDAYLRSGRLVGNPLSMQASIPERQVLILTTSGLNFVCLPRPIDMLVAELNGENINSALQRATET
jgi:hypothetical protein